MPRVLVPTVPSLIFAAGLSLGPAAAQAAAPAPCLTPAPTIDTSVAALQADGWALLPQGEIPASVADRLVWSYVAQYVAGDTGGEALATLVDLQRRTVTGLARKRDIPASATRILTRDDAALVLLWRDTGMGALQLQCRIAVDGPGRTQPMMFAQGETVEVPHGMVTAVLLDRAALSAAIGGPVTTAQVIDSSLSYPAEVAR